MFEPRQKRIVLMYFSTILLRFDVDIGRAIELSDVAHVHYDIIHPLVTEGENPM